MRIIVLDIGGTSIKAGMFEDDRIIQVKEFDTKAKKGGSFVMESAKEIIRSFGEADRIGISTAGQVDSKEGKIRYANANIPEYTGMEVKRIMEEEFHVPTAVENDVNAAAIGEAYFGAGRGFDNFICLTYGTGIGGAIVMNGDVYRGSSFSAGEMGAIIVHPKERDAAKDMFSGCYERYASMTALIQKTLEIDKELSNGRIIFEKLHKAERYEKELQAAVDNWILEISFGLTSLIHIFNPPCVILGGGIMKEKYVIDKVKEKTFANIMESFRNVKIEQAVLGNQAGMFGAAYCAIGNETLCQRRV